MESRVAFAGEKERRGCSLPVCSAKPPAGANERNLTSTSAAQKTPRRLFIISIFLLVPLRSRKSPRSKFSQQAEPILESLATSGSALLPNLNAFRYQLGSEQQDNIEAPNRIKLIQEQIIELRRQLEGELETTSNFATGGKKAKEPVKLNSTACLSSKDCSKWIPKSQCNLESLTCSCLSQHVEFNSTTCLPPGLLGSECLVDAQCKMKVPNSVCQQQAAGSGLCSCLENFVPYRKDKCLPDRQCQLADRHSHCKWRIQNIYGRCACPANFLPVALPALVGGKATTKCAPRLGDFCFEHQECLWATANSSCRLPVAEAGEELARPPWPSSLAPGASRKCFCATGFRQSANKLRCEPIQDDLSTKLITNEELNGRRQTSPSPKTEALTTTTTTPRPTSAGSSSKVKSRASSLGKSCSSRSECQLADKFSDCLNGICECLRPTPKCSSNSTGCHPDAFQCRSGQCISRFFVCDNFRNCEDGSDEENCRPIEGGGGCPPEAFQCASGSHCLALGLLCNGKPDCPDGSDELNCWQKFANLTESGNAATGNGSGRCEPQTFACANGQCLPGYVFCNAISECADGSDENRQLCSLPQATGPSKLKEGLAKEEEPKQQPELKDSTVIKTDRAVINELLRRSNQKQQQLLYFRNAAGSGGKGAAALKLLRRQPKLEGQFRRAFSLSSSLNENPSGSVAEKVAPRASGNLECPEWAFACRNGKCRSKAILCSGVDGCGDNSDEDRCQVCQCEAP